MMRSRKISPNYHISLLYYILTIIEDMVNVPAGVYAVCEHEGPGLGVQHVRGGRVHVT